MADIADLDVRIGSIAEIPKGLDKVANAYADSVAKGILEGVARANRATVTRYQQGVAGQIQKLSRIPLTAENHEEVLQTALASRVYANRAASVARSLGSPAAITIAGMNQEIVRKTINQARQFEKNTGKEQLRAEYIEDAKKRMARNEALYNQEGAELFRKAEDGTLTKEDLFIHTSNIRTYANRYFAAMRAAGKSKSEIEAQEDIHRANMFDIRPLAQKLQDNTDAIIKWTKDFRYYVAAGGIGATVGGALSNTIKTYYGNRKDAYTELGGKIDNLLQWGGGAVGAGIGGMIGGIPGAIVGGAIGSFIGGTWNRNRAAAMSTQEDAIEQLRWEVKYGGQGVGWQYAQLAEKTGFASVADMESLKTASATFGASVAFGQVGADQWFALAHLPNTYAALLSGADEATLLESMRADASMYSPGYAMKFFQMAGFSDNLRVLATSGMLDSLNQTIPKAERMAGYLNLATPALVPMYFERGYKDRTARMNALKNTLMNANDEYYRTIGPGGYMLLGGERSKEEVDAYWNLMREDWDDKAKATLSPTTINVNIDSENVLKIQGVYSDDSALENKVQYTAGSLQE